MAIRVGTSGFSYAEWKGTFYPEKLPQKKMLAYYAERLATVEINATFYRMPKPELLEGWCAEVPPDFTFVLKAPQRITHHRRLVDVQDTVERFCDVATALGDRLGPLLFQLPQHMKKDLALLGAFLEALPRPSPVVVEFGDASWFSDDTFALLREQSAALCIVDDTNPRKAAPFVETAPVGYLRLRRVEYTDAELTAWAERLRGASWRDAYVFFKHEDAGTGPKLAERLKAALAG
ncbi:MAG TPA: DUF72 domain-containing protein [Polyangiaceae bacterium]|jgi:uncharacterized protein YecE (DUF72 family)|nr:DUF72 domain-containing protein [Polyangiaceae bacterium]